MNLPEESPAPVANTNAWWSYLTLTVAFTLYGLSYDATSTVLRSVLVVGFFGFLFVPYFVQRRRVGRRPASSRPVQRYDRTLVLVMGAFIAVLLTIGFAGPRLLTTLGTPLPHTLCWFAVGVLIFGVIPLNRWEAGRRR